RGNFVAWKAPAAHVGIRSILGRIGLLVVPQLTRRLQALVSESYFRGPQHPVGGSEFCSGTMMPPAADGRPRVATCPISHIPRPCVGGREIPGIFSCIRVVRTVLCGS